jgi:hypothetical protein
MSIFQRQLANRELSFVLIGYLTWSLRDLFDIGGALRIIEVMFTGYYIPLEPESGR